VFSRPLIKDLLSRYTRVQLYTDVVPPQFQPTTSADENRKLLTEKFGTAQLPLYVILKPLADGKYAELGRYDEGKINHVAAFERFLREHLPGGGELSQLTGKLEGSQ
jgi:hypothetical protein